MTNSPSALLVSVLFADSDVASIFAELLEAQGVNVTLLTSSEQLKGSTRVITEPRYLPALSPEQYRTSLIVGNHETVKNLPTLALSRPLTEEKVESALAALLT